MLMSFREWKIWFSPLRWTSKWFIVLVLIRPVIDNFYFLKEISPFLSPLYIVGVLTPVLGILSIYSLPKPAYSRLDSYISMWSLLTGISCMAMLVSSGFSTDSLDITMKIILAPVLYFYARRIIRSNKDLHGLLQTFLYSSLFIVIIFLYEIMVNPIGVQISRGMERYHGSFADVLSYSIYMVFSIIILGYAAFNKNSKWPLKNKWILLGFVLSLSVLILFNIHHTASYILVASVIFIYLYHNLRANLQLGLLGVLLAGSLLYFAGSETFSDKILPLVETDLMVYEGERGDEALLHGRMGRWINFFNHFNDQNVIVQLFGLPVAFQNSLVYVGKGAHNDFVRTTMLVGYVGLILYSFILLNLLTRIMEHRLAIRFLGISLLTTLFLYSLTTTPLLYPSILYVIMPFFALLAIPPKVLE
jgi:hypothetical protein